MTETKHAENPQTETARQRVQQEKELSERSRQEYAERAKGKPTPTQEENDLAAHGANILEHEHDGSPPDPFITQPGERRKESEPHRTGTGGYQTRQTTAEPHRTVTPARPSSRE